MLCRFQILCPFRLLQNVEYSSLCYTVGPCWLSILNIVVCICLAQTPTNLSHPTFPLYKPCLFPSLCFLVCGTVSVLFISSLTLFFRFHIKVYYMIFVFIWFILLSMMRSKGSLHVAANGYISFLYKIIHNNSFNKRTIFQNY